MIKKASRTENSFFNFISSMGGQFIFIIMNFICRTVFIHTLGTSYLGINGLFSNILSMLSLAEFGVGNAIIFKLYEPIAQDDHYRIVVLIKFYKRVYRIIGLTIALIGICLIPFLPMLISDYSKLESMHINGALIFLLYLLNPVSSYLFFAYKCSIIKANQKDYLLNIVSYIFTFGSNILQMIDLVLLRNFTLYVVIMVASTIGQNIIGAVLANRMYPYINDKINDKVSTKEVKEVFKDSSVLFLYKMNDVVIRAKDNIVLSIYAGLNIVGLYSNYYIFFTTITILYNKIFDSVQHSLGNLHTTNDREHQYSVFESIFLFSAILGGTVFIGIFVVADRFINTWIGADFILSQPFAFLMGIELFNCAFKMPLSRYRTTMGLFRQAKYRPIASIIISLVVSIVLVQKQGISGVLIGTVVADWTTTMWFDPIIIYKFGFDNYKSVWLYYKSVLGYFTVAFLGAGISFFLVSFTPDHGWLFVILDTCICSVVSVGLYTAIYFRTEAFQRLWKIAGGVARKRFRKVSVKTGD